MGKRGTPSADRQERRKLNELIWNLPPAGIRDHLKREAFALTKGDFAPEEARAIIFNYIKRVYGKQTLEQVLNKLEGEQAEGNTDEEEQRKYKDNDEDQEDDEDEDEDEDWETRRGLLDAIAGDGREGDEKEEVTYVRALEHI